MSDNILYTAHPVMFRSDPVAFIISCILIPAGIGLIILIIWKIRCNTTSIQITKDKIILTTRIFSTETQEINIKDITNIVLAQTLCTQKLKTGNIVIMINKEETVLKGLPCPNKVEEIIRQQMNNEA